MNIETENNIVNSYINGLSMAKAGEKYGYSAATVLRVLNKNNIVKRSKGGIYKLPTDEIIKRYQSGESCQLIANLFNVSFHTISDILEKNNIQRNNRYKNKNVNEDYFKYIDSPDKAYFVGLLFTDGSVSKNSNAVTLSLNYKDVEILDIFSKKVNSENKISVRKDERHNERSFHLKSLKWKNDLAKYNVVPQKTYSSVMPILSKEMMPHLIRGMFDGDGWVSTKAHQIGFCGNEQTVNLLKNYLVQNLDVYNVKTLHPDVHLWQITWASYKDIKRIGDFIYEDKGDCYLKRKYNNFLNIIHANTEVNS